MTFVGPLFLAGLRHFAQFALCLIRPVGRESIGSGPSFFESFMLTNKFVKIPLLNLLHLFFTANKQKHFFGLRKKKSLSTASGGTSTASRSSTLTSMTSQSDNFSTHRSITAGMTDSASQNTVDPELMSIGASCATLSGDQFRSALSNLVAIRHMWRQVL